MRLHVYTLEKSPVIRVFLTKKLTYILKTTELCISNNNNFSVSRVKAIFRKRSLLIYASTRVERGCDNGRPG